MSKDQTSEKCDSADSHMIMSKQHVEVPNPDAAVDVAYNDVDEKDDLEDDETQEAAEMQFATETIVRCFSRRISTSGMILCLLKYLTCDRLFVSPMQLFILPGGCRP